MWGAQQGWNQWSTQPAVFNDVPHDQIDWAELAKQWIQMQQSQPTPEPSAVAPAQVAPIAPGHGPGLMEDIPAVSAPLLKTPGPPGSLPEPFQPERTFEPEPAGFGPKPNDAFWTKPQWEPDSDRGWPAHPVEPAAPLIGGKETFDYGHMHDNPPLAMQSIDYNHMSEFNYNHVPQVYVPPEPPYEQYWSQVSAAPPIAPMFLKKHRSHTSSSSHRHSTAEDDISHLDAAKRKQLPAWIREGLEKMEQERIKKIEKDKAEKEKAEKLAKEKLKSADRSKYANSSLVPEKSKFDSDSEGEDMPDVAKSDVPEQRSPVHKRSPSPIDLRTEEEKKQIYLLTLRRLLTEILLSVTDSEMEAVAEEVLKKEKLKKLKAQQLASTTSLTTKATGLRGLCSYDSGSEVSEAEEEEKDSSDSEEELYRIIREKKKQFALRGKKILAEIERKEIEEQKEAIKQNNDSSKPEEIEAAPLDNSLGSSSKPSLVEEKEPIPFVVPAAEEPAESLPVQADKSAPKNAENDSKNGKNAEKKASYTSDSSSSSSESESSGKGKHKPRKSSSDKKVSKRSREKGSSRKHRSRSSSGSSGRHHRSRSHERSHKRNSSSKKKKHKRSASSSSSGSERARRRKHHSKSESNHNHHRRSLSYEEKDRKHRRSDSPRNYRGSRDSHRSGDSHYKHERDYDKRDSHYDSRRSPSPHRRSSKVPKKYRSSRSPSSDRESSRKSKRSRY